MKKGIEKKFLFLVVGIFLLVGFAGGVLAQLGCSQQLWADEFTSYNSRWEWNYNQGTGYKQLTTIDGFSVVEIGITNQSTSSGYSDCSLHQVANYPYGLNTAIETRLRFSDDNGQTVGDLGRGTRGMGLWYYEPSFTDIDSVWFFSASPQSDPVLRGLRAQFAHNVVPLLNQPLSGVDITKWHIYRIEYTDQGTKFYIDDAEVASTSSTSIDDTMRAEFWIDNYVVTIPGGVPQRAYLNIDINERMYIDWVRLYAYQECQVCPEGQITGTCLCDSVEHSTGYCCNASWQSTPCQLCTSGADTSPYDNIISINELISYISLWKNSGTVTINQLISAIGEWKNGC